MKCKLEIIYFRIIFKYGKDEIMEDKKLLTTQETAQRLRISDGRVRRNDFGRYSRSGKVRSV